MKYILFAILFTTFFSSCYKQVGTGATTTSVDTIKTSKTLPNIMFYNVMDYGNVYITLNNTNNLGGVAKYYPLSYTEGVVGTNNIIATLNYLGSVI